MRVIELARELIRRHTVSDVSTREIADFISNILASAGFQVDQHVYRDGRAVEKVNVIARKGSGEPRLALSGHLDTVPYNESEWNTNPLDLTERQGRFYGMGACDMKGFIALAMCAGMRIGITELRHPFALVFTSDEEVGCVGAKRLVKDKGRIAEMFVIGEPTDLKPVFLHKGYIFLRVTLEGLRGHSSRPAEGRNVVELALPSVVQRLYEFKQALESIRDERFDPPYPTLNIGKVSTGPSSAKNVIADHCVLELDIRPIPGQDATEITEALESFVAPGGTINGIKVKIVPARAPTPPFATDIQARVVQETVQMTGNSPISVSFNTEGGVFNLAGSQSVICGLGSIQQAHRPNEFVDGRYLQEQMVDRYEALIRNMCCAEK